MTLGERLKEYRKVKGLSKGQLAESLNVSDQAITKWESDEELPEIDILIAISKMLEVALDDLVKDDTEIVKKASKERMINTRLSLLSALISFIGAIILIVAGCVELNSSNIALPIIYFICAVVILISAFIQFRRYISYKE